MADKHPKIRFVDVEALSLNPRSDHLFEVGIIDLEGFEQAWIWQAPGLMTADREAIVVNRYYERINDALNGGLLIPKDQVALAAKEIARELQSAVIVARSPQFDTSFIEEFLRAHDQAPGWDRHYLDMHSLLSGYLKKVAPVRSKEVAEALGIPAPPEKDAHTALGDARFLRECYLKIMGGDA